MNCLHEYVIQSYIDNELQEQTSKKVKTHLEECNCCKSLYNEMSNNKQMFFDVLSMADVKTPEIPPMRAVKSRKKDLSIRNIFFYTTSAAAILLGILLYVSNRDNKHVDMEAELIMEDVYMNQNRNEMWQNASDVVMIQNADGEVIKVVSVD